MSAGARAVRWGVPLALVASLASTAAAQVVRGTVTQETSGAPIAGALVELLRADSGEVRAASVLSDPSGAFELRAPGAGSYRLAAKRIGVRRYASAPFALAVGETRRESVVLAPLDFRLPEVVVTANALCTVRGADAARVAALWDEARTALDAAEISLRDRLFTAEVTRYVRELEPATRRVLQETRSRVRGVVGSPFDSLPAESLSVVGYWRRLGDGRTQYFGPDARVLRSDAFLDDHCFRPVTGGRGEGREGLAGLAFVPATDRGVPDVTGTLWLDARTYELRALDFRYDRVGPGVDSAAVGGELQFTRLANGAWLVSRWSLRVPSTGRSAQPLSTEGSAPWLLVRPTGAALREEGGEVVTDAMRPAARPASIAGVVMDSTGRRPVAGVSVTLGDTSTRTMTDAAGRFAFDALTPGPVTLVVRTPMHDTLGVAAARLGVELGNGAREAVTLRLADARALTLALCDGRAAAWGHGTLHVIVRDAANGEPRSGVEATLRWMSTVATAVGDSVPQARTVTSDARGMVAFCDVPSDRTLTLEAPGGTGARAVQLRTQLRAREVRHVELLLRAPGPNE